MPTNLHRYYGAGYLHFITTSCYQRRALLGTPQSRSLFLEAMEQVRRRYRFVVVGYVVMPEHVHLLFSEP
jgi:putative transposase